MVIRGYRAYFPLLLVQLYVLLKIQRKTRKLPAYYPRKTRERPAKDPRVPRNLSVEKIIPSDERPGNGKPFIFPKNPRKETE